MTEIHGRLWSPLAILSVILIGLWLVVHIIFSKTFIFHDSWQHIFPISYGAARHSDFEGLARWMGTVDSGSPLVIYVISFSLTQILRLPFLHLMGLFSPDITSSIFIQKIQIFLTYLTFSGGMYMLGRVLFQKHLSSVYLFAATLYAGFCMNALHSDQIISLIFWLPWAVACAVLFHHNRFGSKGVWYLNGAVFFYSLAVLDEYPHILLLVASIGIGMYILLFRKDCLLFVKYTAFKLWPAIVVIVVLGAQLWIIQNTVADYIPSQRPSLAIDPKAFSTSNFAQPTALISSFLPLGMLAGTEALEKGFTSWMPGLSWLAFNYKLDTLLFNLGFIPVVFALAFVIRPQYKKLRIFWTGFALATFFLASQQSSLYRLLFHLPTLNLFRAYYHFINFFVFAVLVMSGYGMDAYLTIGLNERKRMLRRSLMIAGGLVFVAIVFVLLMLSYAHSPSMPLKQIYRYLTVDILFIMLGMVILWLGSNSLKPHVCGMVIVAVFAVTKMSDFVGTYELVGTPIDKVISRFNLDKDDLIPLPAAIATSPDLFRRKECTVFAQCYLSLRDTVSLQPIGHLEGTFFRSKEEAIYQSGLAESAVKALSGITHPVFWLSEQVAPYSDKHELVMRLNENKDHISQYLSSMVHVYKNDLGLISSTDALDSGKAELTYLERGKDVMRLQYRAEKQVFLNAALTYNAHWTAAVNGVPVPLVRGNFNGLALRLPSGAGTVEIRYSSWKDDFLFNSRYLSMIAALLIIGIVIKTIPPRKAKDVEDNNTKK